MSTDKTTKPVRIADDGGHVIFCPGCEGTHHLQPGVWSFNGDMHKPTFSPSLLYTSGHCVQGQQDKLCWCTYEQRTGRKPPKFGRCGVCHSFVRDGKIQYLGDSTHALAGQTVPLPDWPYAPGTYGGITDVSEG